MKHDFDYTTPAGSPNDIYNGKVWYGPKDKKAVKSPGFSTWEEARRWIFSQPKTGRYKAARRSTVLRNGMLHMIVEAQ